MKNTSKHPTCLFPQCETPPMCRGLCSNHYQRAQRLVMRGAVTWDELEDFGKCRPKTPSVGIKDSNKWFVDGIKTEKRQLLAQGK